jgi:uncharacterized protein (DUF433 family)
MLEQEKTTKFYTGYDPQEIISEIDIAMVSITQTNFPYIEIAKFAGGPRAVIRGTRIPVSVVIGYLLAGETPQTLTEKILPHITLAQIRDAILYYATHRPQIDEERRENTEEAGRKFLRETLGDDKYTSITGV